MSTAANTGHQGIFMESELLLFLCSWFCIFRYNLVTTALNFLLLFKRCVLILLFQLDGSGGFMGDLVFNGGAWHYIPSSSLLCLMTPSALHMNYYMFRKVRNERRESAIHSTQRHLQQHSVRCIPGVELGVDLSGRHNQ